MKSTAGDDASKRRAAESAADRVTDGELVGLGTGSTAAHAIRELGRRIDAGLEITGVPTSYASRETAQQAGIPLRPLADVGSVDTAIDGADQVVFDDGPTLVKGGGAAHAREKIVDAAADQFLVVVDRTKLAEELTHPVPVEILPDARTTVAREVRAAGGEPSIRSADRKDGPVITDNGNLVIDCAFGTVPDPRELQRTLDRIPGIVEHGLFMDLADAVHVGNSDGVTVED